MATYYVRHEHGDSDAQRLTDLSEEYVGRTWADYHNGKLVALRTYVDAQDEADAIAAAHKLWQRDYNWEPPKQKTWWHVKMDTDGCEEGWEFNRWGESGKDYWPVRFFVDTNGRRNFSAFVKAEDQDDAKHAAIRLWHQHILSAPTP